MTKQEQVYNAVRAKIVEGTYGPGYRLVIDRIAEDFSVSALPVREAIRRLEAEGLVIFRANVGAQVSPADPRLFEQNLAMLAVMEGYATRLAAPLMDEQALAEAEVTIGEMADSVEHLDILGIGTANHRFHAVIVSRCGNPPLIALVEDVGRRLDAIRRTVFTHIPYRGQSSVEDHREILELIRRRAKPDKIEQAARAHKMRTLEAFVKWEETHGPAAVSAE